MERGKVESFQRKKPCVLTTLCPGAKLCLYLLLPNNQHCAVTFVAVGAAGVQMDTANDLIDTEFSKNRQLLWAVLTPGEDFRGDNNDCAGLLSRLKLLLGMEKAIAICCVMTTFEEHTYSRGELYSVDFQKPSCIFLSRQICSGSWPLTFALDILNYPPYNQCDNVRV